MPKQKRFKTDYPGVYYIEGTKAGTDKPERIYYYYFRKDGRKIEEKAGRQFKHNMTPAKANIIRGQKIDGSKPTNQELREADEAKKKAEANKWTVNRLWESYKENKTNMKDLKNDQNRFDNYIAPSFGNMEPQEILPLDIKRLENNLLKKKAPATVKNILELLRRIVNFGSKNQLCPAIGFTIEMPRINNEKTEDLTDDQLVSLLTAIEEDTHPQAGDMMLMALYTGIRRGELFKLKWKHINFDREFITLRDPKGGPDQKIPLTAARELLENHPRTKSPYVFPGRGGRQRTDIHKAVNAIKKKAGLPDNFRALHGLRHTFASALASSGKVDLYQLQRLLTHKSPQMVQRYAHLRGEVLQQASNVAADIFQPAKKEDKSNVVELNRK